MIDMQRYSAYHSGDPHKVGLWANADGEWVLYSDAEAAIAAAEQQAYDRGVQDMKPQADRIDAMLAKAMESAERDVLARAIAAVEASAETGDFCCGCDSDLDDILAALRGLGSGNPDTPPSAGNPDSQNRTENGTDEAATFTKAEPKQRLAEDLEAQWLLELGRRIRNLEGRDG